MKTIYLGAGCFWGVQYYFDLLDGVTETEVGYMGGNTENPSYDDVCSGETLHVEVTKITYDTTVIDDEKLLKHFFAMHNPTQGNRQGPDVGVQYRSVVYYTDDEQRLVANKIIADKNVELAGRITTTVEKAPQFWPAEDYHQKFAERTGRGMCHVLPTETGI